MPLWCAMQTIGFWWPSSSSTESEQAPTIILEPAGRNTAPAIALAAIHSRAIDPEALLLVLPADHHVTDPAAFRRAVEQASERAMAGTLMTFGVVPSHAETGYGYVRCGAEWEEGLFELAEFVEKPDQDDGAALCGLGHLFLEQRHVFVASRSLFS